MRLVVEVRRGFEARVVLNQLMRHTRLQGRFSCNMVGARSSVWVLGGSGFGLRLGFLGRVGARWRSTS